MGYIQTEFKIEDQLDEYCLAAYGIKPEFVSNSQDVNAIKVHCGVDSDARLYDSFFVVAEDGEYKAIFGIYGIIPGFSKSAFRVTWGWKRANRQGDKLHECEGKCENHYGDVKLVNVTTQSGLDWGNFYYCDCAIDNEKINKDGTLGFIVSEI